MSDAMAKKDTLKSNLIRKKPVITENKAQEIVEKVHTPSGDSKVLEPTVKTSIEFRKTLFKAMKIKLIDEEKTMREYLEGLIEADINK